MSERLSINDVTRSSLKRRVMELEEHGWKPVGRPYMDTWEGTVFINQDLIREKQEEDDV